MDRASLVLGATALLWAAGAATAGDRCDGIVYCDDLDTYVPGPLAGQECVRGTSCQDPGCPEGCRWEPWDGDPGGDHAEVVDDPAESDPNSLEIDGPDDMAHTYKCFDLTEGLHQYTVDLFIPSDYSGDTYFILLNTYTGDGDPNSKNWSTQLHFESDSGRIISDFDIIQNEVPFVRGAWKTLRVVMDLDDESVETGQWIYYDDELIIAKSWIDGVTGGGASRLEAMDVFANGASPVFYDNFRICELSRLGACCFADEDGTCTDGEIAEECESAGGVYQGFGSTCFAGRCPKLGDEGWEVAAPFTWDDRQGRNDTCDTDALCEEVYVGPDIQFEIEIPWESNWRFSTVGSEIDDTEMLIGTTGLCAADLVDRDGCVPGPGCSGSQDEIDSKAFFTIPLGEEDLVNVNVEELNGQCGKITLTVEAPCPDITLPAGDPENETCRERENDGCNMDPGLEAFTPIALGQTYLGKSWAHEDGTERDTDWYEIDLEPGEYRMTSYGEFGGAGLAGLAEYDEGREGSGDCADITDIISPFGVFDRCRDHPDEGPPLVVEFEITVPGTYWLVVLPGSMGVDFDCDEDPGADYYITIDTACVPAPDGDVNFDGCTDFADVLIVLSRWGSDGSEGGDIECDGDVDFDDLLRVLAWWSGEGECD